MVVRGAPAIAIAAALSLAVDLVNGGEGSQFDSPTAAATYIKEQLDYLVTRCAILQRICWAGRAKKGSMNISRQTHYWYIITNVTFLSPRGPHRP
jgi:methylthioribose-1-phosphate isomerase